MLDYINHNFDRTYRTLEDPIEFSYRDDKSLFNQREVELIHQLRRGAKGYFAAGPRYIILVGEMRDKATFDTALTAAEKPAHLVCGHAPRHGSPTGRPTAL
jgi:twitching motility protein PilT